MLETRGVVERVHVGPLEPVARHHEQVDGEIRPLEGLELRRLAATSEFMLSLPLMRSLPKVSATATAALRINAAWTVPTLSPALGSSCGASSRSIFGRWQQCSLSSSAAFDLCCQIRLLCRPRLVIFSVGRPSESLALATRVASLDLVVLGDGPSNRIVEARAAVRPTVQPLDARAFWGH